MDNESTEPCLGPGFESRGVFLDGPSERWGSWPILRQTRERAVGLPQAEKNGVPLERLRPEEVKEMEPEELWLWGRGWGCDEPFVSYTKAVCSLPKVDLFSHLQLTL